MIAQPSSQQTGMQASVRGNVLILTFMDAVHPAVWQSSLDDLHSSAFEVAPAVRGFALYLKSPGGDVREIALYDAREQAVGALAFIHHALAGNDIGAAPATGGSAFSYRNAILAGTSVILFVLLAMFIMSLVPAPRGAGAPTAIAAPTPSGTPMSAEDALKGQIDAQ